jgi:UDP-N-acetyl-D-mannosaminuronate dehydrogenase
MELLTKIKNKQALVGIIGLGYVGLPLVLRFCEVGFPVLGFDTDPRKVELLKRGESYIKLELAKAGNPMVLRLRLERLLPRGKTDPLI